MLWDMQLKKILCFGEVLWDCLPDGLFLGGAPLNVASHLQRLGADGLMVSAVGDDTLGEEALKRIRERGLAITEIAVAEGIRTGIARAVLDAEGNASYEFPSPCAWDGIPAEPALAIASEMDAIVFGTLATRSPQNEDTLEKLLSIKGPLRIFDINIRQPYFDRLTASVLAQKADVLKINDEELAVLTGMEIGDEPPEGALQLLSTITGVRRICLTRGADGAVFWDQGNMTIADSPPTDVADTVGAGDSFTAAIILGLLEGESPDVFLPRACRLGSLVASHRGAVPDYDCGQID